MKWKWFTYLIVLVLNFGWQSNLVAQNVELTSQAQVDAFTGTKINGYLLIRGDDITDLSPLNSIDTIVKSLFIEYNRSLKVLNGFDSLCVIGGSLFVEGNSHLDSVGTFGKLKMIKGPLVLRHNHLLRECCAFYPLLTGEQGIIWGGTIIHGNKGCDSEKELRRNCDDDTDNDGVDDADDGCPLDSLKIHPGICGCGVSEVDSDGDGTPDCNDECPNDPNKSEEGDCGCGKLDTDSDGDGAADCIDDCPSNPSIINSGICGCTNPRIIDIKVANRGACNDNGTPTALDDTYPVDVTIFFEGPPTSGKLLLTGGTNETISFYSSFDSKSITLFQLPFVANGKLIEVVATYEGNEKCTKRRVFGIWGEDSCSSGACDPPSSLNAFTESYPNAALLTWSDLGIGATYEVEYRPSGTNNWATELVNTNQLLISGLADYTAYEYRIRTFCDGEKYSDYVSASFTTGGNECKLVRAEVQNINCNDNQTPDDMADDYFTFNLYVEGTNVGDVYTVANVVGENTGQYNMLTTFRTASGTLGNGDISILITDNADPNCQLTATVADPGVCSNDCTINYLTIGEVIKCYDRGSRWNTKDDYYTADLTVYYTNAPAAGELKLTGKVRGSVSTESLQNSNSYTFQAVRIPAGGSDFEIGATFTNGIDCEYSTNFKGLLISNNGICMDVCNITNVQVLNVACSDNETSGTNDDYVTFELVVTGANVEGTYQVSNVAGTSTGIYNQPSFFRTNSGLIGQMIDLTITDSEASSCSYSLAIDNDCKSQSRIQSNVSLPTVNTNNQLSLYPNPANDEIFLDYHSRNLDVAIEVYDLLGQKLIVKPMTDRRLDISQLGKGIYHLVLRDGDNFQTKKFIKE